LAKRQHSLNQCDFRLPDACDAELGFGGRTGVFEDYEVRGLRGYFPR
jgi:isocitrate lyase